MRPLPSASHRYVAGMNGEGEGDDFGISVPCVGAVQFFPEQFEPIARRRARADRVAVDVAAKHPFFARTAPRITHYDPVVECTLGPRVLFGDVL